MKVLNNLVLKHLACAYVLYCKENLGSYVSFEEYCNRYSHTLKTAANAIHHIMNSANKTMKKEKKKVGKKYGY